MMRSKITRILSYKHQKHQKNYSTFRQFSNYTHYSALFRGAKLRNSGTPKGQGTVLIYDNTLLLFRIRTCPLSPSSGVLPLTLLNLGCTRHSSSQLGSALICTRFQAAVSYRGLSWHTSSVGVSGYAWYCPPGNRVPCATSVL